MVRARKQQERKHVIAPQVRKSVRTGDLRSSIERWHVAMVWGLARLWIAKPGREEVAVAIGSAKGCEGENKEADGNA